MAQGHTIREQQQIIRMERRVQDAEDRLAKLNQLISVAEKKIADVVATADTVAGVLGTPRTANTILAGPAAGAAAPPTWRALVAADIPGLDAAKIVSGIFNTARIPALDAAQITTGVLNIARLATGVPTGLKFVRDDSTLVVP